MARASVWKSAVSEALDRHGECSLPALQRLIKKEMGRAPSTDTISNYRRMWRQFEEQECSDPDDPNIGGRDQGNESVKTNPMDLIPLSEKVGAFVNAVRVVGGAQEAQKLLDLLNGY